MEQSILPCVGQGDFPKRSELEARRLQIWTRGIVSSLYVTHALEGIRSDGKGGRQGNRLKGAGKLESSLPLMEK